MGLDGAEFIKNAEVKPGSYLGEMLMKRQGLTFLIIVRNDVEETGDA